MSRLEKVVQQAVETGFDSFVKLDEEIVVWWLMKIYYSKLIKELFFKDNIKDPASPIMITEDKIGWLKGIYYYMSELLKGIKFESPKPHELYIFKTDSENDFDNLDDVSRHVVYMQMNDILIVCAFDSFSIFDIQYKREIDKLRELDIVSPIQALELFTKIVYFKTYYEFQTKHETIIN